jgi:hypothetical protein
MHTHLYILYYTRHFSTLSVLLCTTHNSPPPAQHIPPHPATCTCTRIDLTPNTAPLHCHVLSFLARFQKRSSMLPDNNTHLPMNNRYQQQCTPLMHLLVRLSIRGLRVLQGRRLRSANSRFPCVDLVTLRSSPYSIIDFSCQYGTSSWTMVLHARFAHNHVLRVHCLTFRRRLLLCLV